MIVDELVAILGYDVKGDAELRRFNIGLDNAQRKASAFAAAMVKVGVVAATAVATGMAALGKSVVSTSAQFESYQATLETIEGSSEKARASMDWISDFAKRTPFDVAELTEAFVRLRAYGLDPTSGLMESLGDASSAMGKSLMQSVEMIADASTGEFERLKEFGLRASQAGDQVTFSWTKNGEAMTKTVKKNGAEIVKFIQTQFGERFNGAMIRQSKTWNGMMANLGDSWVDFQRRIGEGGFFEAVKGQLGRLLDYIGQLDADGTIDRWSKYLSDGLTWGVDAAVFALDRLQRHFKFITGWVDANPEWLGPIKTALLSLGAVVFPRTAAIIVLEDILSWMQGSDSVIGNFAKSLNELTGVDVDTLGTIMATLAGGASLAVAAGGMKTITTAIKGLTAALVALGGGAAAGGMAILGRLGLIGAAGAGAIELGSQVKSGDTLWSQGKTWFPGIEDVLHWGFDGLTGGGSDKGGRVGGGSFDESRFDGRGATGTTSGAMENWFEHQRRMSASGAVAAAVNDNSQDHRDQSNHVTVEVGGVHVQQATQAPAAVGQAVGNAAAGAARVSRYEQDGAF